MMNSNSIIDIWDNLSMGKEVGLTKRRVPIESPLCIYGTYRYPDNLFGIAFSYNKNLTIPLEQFRSLGSICNIMFRFSKCRNKGGV